MDKFLIVRKHLLVTSLFWIFFVNTLIKQIKDLLLRKLGIYSEK